MKDQSRLNGQTIEIDVPDWLEEYEEFEPDITADDPIIALAIAGCKPQQIGRLFIIGGERGDFEMFPGSKLLVMAGGAHYASQHIANQREKITLPNGEIVEARAYVAPIRGDDGEEEDDQAVSDYQKSGITSSSPAQNWLNERVVGIDDPKSFDRAVSYLLMKPVPGTIYERLKIIALHRPEEVRRVANKLKAEITRMVKQLE